MLVALGTMPLLAQDAPSGGDVPVIDLDAMLDAPTGPDITEVLMVNPDQPAADTADTAPAFPVEIPEDGVLTIPIFERSDPLQNLPVPESDEVLLPLHAKHPTLDGIVRLTGEVQREDFFIDLPLAGAAQDVVLSYRIAINVLPEQSQLLIRINGADLSPIEPNAFEGFEQLILPGALLKEGRNEISVSAHHAHRIFCGPDATFAVWTEINTNTSGVRLLRRDLPTDATGLMMALRAQVAASGNLAVRMADDLVEDGLLDALGPRLTGLRGGGPVVLVTERAYGVAEGLVPMARITVVYGAAPAVDVRRAGDGAVVMLLTVGYDGKLPDLDTLLPLPAPVPNVAPLPPGIETALAYLGFDQPNAFNRYTEQTVTFRLPDDWLLLASQKAVLRLGYGFPEGLPKGALMLVKVNGTTIRMLPLDRDGGKALPALDVDFRARLLLPGANALTFVTIVPGDPPNQPCPPMSAPLTIISPQSTLLVPPSPQMRMIGLDRPLVALQPDQINGLVSATKDTPVSHLPATLAAAMRPVAQAERISGASLTITSTGAEESLQLGDLGISRRDLARLLPAENALSLPEASPDQTDPPGLTDRTKRWFQGFVRDLVKLAIPDDGPLLAWLKDRPAEALLFIPKDDAPEAMWLMVRADNNPQRLASILAQARLSAEGPRGRFAILTPEGTWESWRTTRTAPQLLEPLSVRNFRVVAGNYASWSPLLFGGLLLSLTLLSVCLALVFVITTRGKRKR